MLILVNRIWKKFKLNLINFFLKFLKKRATKFLIIYDQLKVAQMSESTDQFIVLELQTNRLGGREREREFKSKLLVN